MRSKPRDVSEHHGAFGRMRLRFDGILTTGCGARLHRFEFRRYQGSRWERTAAEKIARHLGDGGYTLVSSIDTPDNTGTSGSRRRIYRRGTDEVQVSSWYDKDGGERVNRVEHFPAGTAGDDRRPRITIDQVISAMSWGCA